MFYIYLLGSVVLAFLVLFKKENSVFKSFQFLFDKRIFLHPSTGIDVSLLFVNSLLKGFLFFFVGFNSIWVASFVARFFTETFPGYQAPDWPFIYITVAYTIFSFVLLDFSRFFQHYLMHKIPLFWRFHKIHHSAEVLSPLTLYRTHPLESILASFRRILVIGISSGLFIFLSKSVIGVIDIWGVNSLDFIFNILGSNLRHSHVWLTFGPLSYVFISPAQHQVHHGRDPRFFDKNFGVGLAIWDLLFGSFYYSKRKEFVTFGLRETPYRSIKDVLLRPLGYAPSQSK